MKYLGEDKKSFWARLKDKFDRFDYEDLLDILYPVSGVIMIIALSVFLIVVSILLIHKLQ